ncbi:mechanosensitive ion channel family protein [Pseudomonas sp. ZM23]|uniref:Mechanosensitive ion channel n=1 Tax=Pseudomonas triclosanedens TaxID=2961893 RepID=A0ABY7A842_9PSED|nr:mechanosensitive ion channel domain-containing protein [Pseudomonas triclosanedens]MCP8466267.1 mechanosensitive ion channel family protein [Pseudomonas triclosanedens]MCP8471793.1 mechanosensitive ion channel family protein [Pseudomonas triclosanedens]MCP8478488.1 mechanosensitive ion channel family protein [Pseudomonas triclosanedens]WAI52315.1 mechanosensitive ion channel [Pseudomonas triclosanedens]
MLDLWTPFDRWTSVQVFLNVATLCAAVILGLRMLLPLAERLTCRMPFVHELLVQSRTPLLFLAPLLVIHTLWDSSALPNLELPRHVSRLLIIAVLTWLGLRLVRSLRTSILRLHPVTVSDNLRARRVHTQVMVLERLLSGLVLILGIAAMLMTFPAASQFGASLLASAGLAGLAVGFAAKPVLGNLIAGLQIALTQPIRLDDVVIVQGEWGRIEEITGTFVVVRIWDDRRLVVPLQWFIENPFQNWTRATSNITGALILWVDYRTPLEPLRQELDRLCKSTSLWDGRVSVLQAIECSETAVQLRVLVSAADSSRNWDLRCFLREHLLLFITTRYPQSLPLVRAAMLSDWPQAPGNDQAARVPERQPPV